MSDYMQEAERLADAYANAFFCEKSVTEILETRAALRGEVKP